MDFGIARLTEPDGPHLTRQGDIVGTIRYMSPEQFTTGTVTVLSDIFAYGVVFYELLSDRHPFDAPDDLLSGDTVGITKTISPPRKVDAATLMLRITKSNPQPLSEAVPGIPPLLERVVNTALEKDPDLRYQGLEDLLLELRPLRLELQKGRAAELVLKSRGHFDSGELSLAQAAIREAIELDSANPDAWKLREKIQEAAHSKSVRPKVEALLKAGAEASSLQQYDVAVEMLESAAKLDPRNATVQEQLQSARARKEHTREATRLLGEAQKELDSRNLVLAESLARQALSIDVENSQARALADTIHRQIEQRSNERLVRQVLETARRLVVVEDFDGAIERLEAVQDVAEGGGEVRALLARIREQKAERERQERLRSEKQALRGVLKEARLEEALPRLEALCRQFPEDADLAVLLADTRQQLRQQKRSEDVRAVAADLEHLRRGKNFGRADELLRRLSEIYPEDSEILSLGREVERDRKQHERDKVSGALKRIEQLRSERRFDAARQAAREARQEFPDDRELAEAQRRIDQAEAAHQVAERSRQAHAAAQKEMASGNWDAAVGLLERALLDDPHHTGMGQLMREAVRRADLDRISRTVDQICAEARAMADRLEFDPAIEKVRSALVAYPSEVRLHSTLDEIATRRLQAGAQQRLGEIVEVCNRLIREKRFPEAVFQLTMELRKQPGDPTLTKLREKAAAEWEASKRAEALGRALGEIRRALEQGQYLEAELLVAHYRPEYGNEPPFAALRASVEEGLKGIDRARRLDERLRAIQEAEAQGNWDLAQAACREAIEDLPDEVQFASRLERIEVELARSRREAEFARREQAVRKSLTEHDLAGAGKELAAFERDYPSAPPIAALHKLLDDEKRKNAAAKALVDAAAAVARRDWGAADRALTEAEASAAAPPEVADLRTVIKNGRRRDQTVAEARKAAAKKRWEEAEKLLAPLASSDPPDAEAAALLAETVQRRQDAEGQSAILQGLAEAVKLTRTGGYDQAVELLRGLAERYGTNPELERATTTALERRQKAKEFADDAARCREAISRKDWPSAAVALDEVARRWPNEAGVAALRNELQAARAQAANDELLAAEAAIEHGGWADAEARIAESLQTAPESSRHRELRVRIEDGRKRDRTLAAAQAALDAGRLEELERLLAPLAKDAKAAALLAEVKNRKDAEASRQAVANGLEQAANLTAAGDLSGAAAALEQLAAAYRGNVDVERALGETRATRDREQAAVALAAQGREPLAAREWKKAAAHLTELEQRFAGSAAAVEYAAALEQARRQGSDEALAEAEAAVFAGNWNDAGQWLAEAAEALPGAPRCGELQAKLQEARDAVAAGVAEAAGLASSGRFDAAIEALDRIEQRFGRPREVEEARAGVGAARERAAAAEAAITAADQAIAARDWAEAERHLVKAAEFGADPARCAEAGARLETEREKAAEEARVEEAAKTAGQACAAIAARDWTLAGRLAQEFDHRFSDFPAGAEVRSALSAARQQAAGEALAAAGTAIGARDWTAAESLLATASELHPDVAGRAEIAARLTAEKQRAVEEARAAEGARLSDEAGAAIAACQWARAAELLADLDARFEDLPGRKKLRARFEKSRRQAVDQELDKAEAAVAARQWTEAEASLAAASELLPAAPRCSEVRNKLANSRRTCDAAEIAGRTQAAVAAQDWAQARILVAELEERFADLAAASESRVAFEAAIQQATDAALDRAEAAIGAHAWPDAERELAAAIDLLPDWPRCTEVGAHLLAARAGAAIEARDWAQAARLVAELEQRFAQSPAARETRAQLDKARREAIEEVLREADSAISAARWADAEHQLALVVETFGEGPRVSEVRARLTAERRKTIARGIEEASGRAVAGDFDAALDALRGLTETYGPNPDIERARRELTTARDRAAEAARIAEQATAAIAARDWMRANQQVEDLERRLVEQPVGKDLRARLETARREAAEEAAALAGEAVARRDWQEAERHYVAARAAAPDFPRLAEVRAAIDAGRKREERIKAARAASDKKRYAEAEKLLGPLLAENAGDAQAAALAAEVHQHRTAAEAAEAVAQGLKVAAKLGKSRKHEAAAELLAGLIDRYGANPEVERQLVAAREAEARHALEPEIEAAAATPPLWRQPLWIGVAAGVVVVAIVTVILLFRGGKSTEAEAKSNPAPRVVVPPPSPAQPKESPKEMPVATTPPAPVKSSGDPIGDINQFLSRHDWTNLRAAINSAPPELRQNPKVRAAAEKLQERDDNQKLLEQANRDWAQGNYAAVEAAAKLLAGTEFKADANNLNASLRGKRDELAHAVDAAIAAKNLAGARAALEQARKLFPNDARWNDYDPRIKDLEPKTTAGPPCPGTAVNPGAIPEGWNGASERDIVWTGELPANCTLALQGFNASTGKISSENLNRIPKAPGTVPKVSPMTVTVLQQPTADNQFKVVLKNTSTAPVGRIEIHWVMESR
jgi:hypothetical protein